MRKGIAILIMIFVSVNFYLYLKRMKPNNGEEKQLPQILEAIEEEIYEIEPDDPVAVVTVHNTLMNYLYAQETSKEQVEKIVPLQRKLYETEFLNLTSQEEQIESIHKEREKNKEKSIKILQSKIMNSYEEPPGVVKTEVIHYTNQADIVRLYLLKKDYDQEIGQEMWKIYGWKSIISSDIQEEVQ